MGSPGLAAVLSFLWTGLGQIYNGEVAKGLLMMVAMFVFIVLSVLLIGIPFVILLWVYGIFDAYRTADQKNRAEQRAAQMPPPFPVQPGYAPPGAYPSPSGYASGGSAYPPPAPYPTSGAHHAAPHAYPSAPTPYPAPDAPYGGPSSYRSPGPVGRHPPVHPSEAPQHRAQATPGPQPPPVRQAPPTRSATLVGRPGDPPPRGSAGAPPAPGQRRAPLPASARVHGAPSAADCAQCRSAMVPGGRYCGRCGWDSRGGVA